jgi:hypothetical protein
MLAADGQLRRTMHGPSVHLAIPKEALASNSDPDTVWPDFNEHEASRRTVYALVNRSLVVPMLEVLDLCDTTRSSERRTITSVPTQALTLLNGDETNRQARHLAERLRRDVGDDPARQIVRAFELTLCRLPTTEESAELQAYLKHETHAVEKETSTLKEPVRATRARDESLVRLCRAIFNLNEFVYAD